MSRSANTPSINHHILFTQGGETEPGTRGASEGGAELDRRAPRHGRGGHCEVGAERVEWQGTAWVQHCSIAGAQRRAMMSD